MDGLAEIELARKLQQPPCQPFVNFLLDFFKFKCYIILMTATKAHFEFTATLISAARNGVAPEHLATMAAAKFKKDNPRFDADRFKRACGLTWGEIEKTA